MQSAIKFCWGEKVHINTMTVEISIKQIANNNNIHRKQIFQIIFQPHVVRYTFIIIFDSFVSTEETHNKFWWDDNNKNIINIMKLRYTTFNVMQISKYHWAKMQSKRPCSKHKLKHNQNSWKKKKIREELNTVEPIKRSRLIDVCLHVKFDCESK